MPRIVAGSARGRSLQVPKSGTRPTSERVREALFSRLDHYGYIQDCAVLDLYAGSGALALEAMSRGAREAYAVEAARAAAQIIKANAKAAGLTVHVVNQKAETFLAAPSAVKFDLALLDPPYDVGEDALGAVLELLVGHLKPDALVVVERNKRSAEPLWPAGLRLDDARTMGDTTLWSAAVVDDAGEAGDAATVD